MTLLGEFVMSAKVAAKHHLGDLLQSLERLREPNKRVAKAAERAIDRSAAAET